MRIYLAGAETIGYLAADIVEEKHPYVLGSFYYANSNVEKIIPYCKDFLADSGAFTFVGKMKSKSKSEYENIDWRAYIHKYAAFIKKHKIKHFFELDIDSIVGYDKVLGFRDELEQLVGLPSIPVWHIPRGKEVFLEDCEKYDYVALGGIAGKEGDPVKYGASFPWFIKQAHLRGTEIHGLGMTGAWLKYSHFDSVDSTTWSSGGRYGHVLYFDGQKMTKYPHKSPYKLNNKAVQRSNLLEWIKFSEWAEVKR